MNFAITLNEQEVVGVVTALEESAKNGPLNSDAAKFLVKLNKMKECFYDDRNRCETISIQVS